MKTPAKELYMVASCDKDKIYDEAYPYLTYAAAEKDAIEREEDEPTSEDRSFRVYIFKAVAYIDRAKPVIKKL
jgi:hypothetical protein